MNLHVERAENGATMYLAVGAYKEGADVPIMVDGKVCPWPD